MQFYLEIFNFAKHLNTRSCFHAFSPSIYHRSAMKYEYANDESQTSNLKPQTILQLGLSPVSEQEMSAKRFCRGVNDEYYDLNESFCEINCSF